MPLAFTVSPGWPVGLLLGDAACNMATTLTLSLGQGLEAWVDVRSLSQGGAEGVPFGRLHGPVAGDVWVKW